MQFHSPTDDAEPQSCSGFQYLRPWHFGKRGDHRVDIETLLPTDPLEPNVTGGYIIRKDRLDPGDVGFSTIHAVGDGDYPWFRRLFQDPDFNQRYIDRWGELRGYYRLVIP